MNLHRSIPGVALLWASAIILSGCGSKAETTRPLIDSEHGAAVLVEQRVLSNPRSIDQNRILRGWRFVRSDDGIRLFPNARESVVEIVHLKGRPRVLIIDVVEYQPGDTVRARADRFPLGTYPVTDRIEINLPAGLPLGRTAVTLGFSNHETTVLAGMSISPNTATGAALIKPGVVEQSGWSAVEVVHRVAAGARLTTEFHPPVAIEPGQRFAITVQRKHEPAIEVFSWDSSAAVHGSDSLKVDAPLGGTAGPARIRLLAEGPGPAARWVDPRIVEMAGPPETDRPISLGEPPRLVVLYVMDALRADHVGATGPDGSFTPVLDQLAAEGLSFENHFAVAPNTPPSTRALFSGLCMLDDRQLPSPGPRRLAEVFLEAGYRTVSVTGNPHLSPDLDLGAGFESVEMLRVREDHNPNHPPTVNNSAEILHEAALGWIDALGPDERGFLYIHSMNPHNPYTPPRELVDRFAPSGASSIDGRTRTLVAVRDLERNVTPGDVDRLRRLYSAGVAYNDGELGALLEEIDRRYDPEQVLFALTSDHGEELFEHDGVLHGFTLYDEMLRIPLIVRWPGRIRPGRIEALTNTRDLQATMTELALGSAADAGGASLWPLIGGIGSPDANEEITFAAAPGLAGAVMARSHRWKLIRVPRNGPDRGMGNGRGRSRDVEYVFDLINDRDERHNLAGIDEIEVAWLRARLTAWTTTQQALQPAPGDRVMDDETKGQLEALGYVMEQ